MHKTEDPTAINRHYPTRILEQRKWA